MESLNAIVSEAVCRDPANVIRYYELSCFVAVKDFRKVVWPRAIETLVMVGQFREDNIGGYDEEDLKVGSFGHAVSTGALHGVKHVSMARSELDSTVSYTAYRVLKHVAKLPKLESLRLDGSTVDSKYMAALATLKFKAPLKTLSLLDLEWSGGENYVDHREMVQDVVAAFEARGTEVHLFMSP
jgi:hypothetical protein